ncbi:MAG: glycosyltransferase family 2 protein, partial [Pseudomonadota bacterium]
MSMGEGVKVSVVFPVYNEEDNLKPLLEEILPILKSLGLNFEILCIDDASSDTSLSLLRELQKKYPELRVIQHVINSGESAATATGFTHARGDVIITMDADQQNDPADIPALLEALKGVDGVCGVRRTREDDWVKRISSRTANAFRNWTTKDTIADAGCTFRALRRDAVREIPVFNGMH